MIIVDSEYDPESIFESAKRFNKTLHKYNLEFDFDQKNPDLVSVKDALIQRSVIKGIIKAKPNSNNSETYQGNVLYIKLSAPNLRSADFQTLPYNVRQYMEKNPVFPQESTSDIFFSAEQVSAYRDLGYTIASQPLVKNWLKTHEGAY